MVGVKISKNPGAKDAVGNSTKINARKGKTVTGITGANIVEFGAMVTTIARNDWERPEIMETLVAINHKVKIFMTNKRSIMLWYSYLLSLVVYILQ